VRSGRVGEYQPKCRPRRRSGRWIQESPRKADQPENSHRWRGRDRRWERLQAPRQTGFRRRPRVIDVEYGCFAGRRSV